MLVPINSARPLLYPKFKFRFFFFFLDLKYQPREQERETIGGRWRF